MFAVTKKRLFWWPVTVRIPHPDKAGAFEAHSFEMQFEAMSLERAREIDAGTASLSGGASEVRPFAFLREVCRGWRDVVDEAGESVPFTPEAFGAQLQFGWFSTAVFEAYQEAVSGQEPRLGN